jgi:hypothetical protein
MRALSKTFLLLLAVFGLASCDGGGGGSQSAFNATPVDSIAISAGSTSIPTNSFTILTVSVKRADGTVEADGTSINATVTPATAGVITPASNTLTGGTTTFGFASSNQTGTATITISVPAGTNGTTTTATKSIPITVTQGNGQDSRVQLSATSTTLPVSPYTFAQQQAAPFPGNFLGSPYIAEVTITLRHINGQLVAGGTANASISPTSVAGLSTGTGTTFQTITPSVTVAAPAGVATVYVHAGNVAGTAVLTVTATDPDSGQIVSSQLTITVAGGGSAGLPVSITASTSGPAYVSDSGGQSAIVTARVTDGSNAVIPNPVGFDNVEFQITSLNTDAQLSGVNAAGQAVKGTTIDVATHNGIAAVTLVPGLQQGSVQVKATADRGDNNVDNGIQDPVSATTTVVISDGKLYSLSLASPILDAIVANSVSDQAGVTPGTSPTDPNATYSFTVSVSGVDRQLNPVLPGTVIRFGGVDSPQSNGVLSISGLQGNPQEGGTLFTALDGHFRTAGGGAGPGDTLIVFGKETHGAPPGNADLESAATVARINSETSLNVVTPFNRNDTTGVSVDNGNVLPYVIGRALIGNIASPATTNEKGVATTQLSYPVSALGRPVAIYAQGNGTDNITGQSTLVTDARLIRFPGIAPATITVSPNPIPGNLTTTVFACIQDALQEPISGVRFAFSFTGLGIGTGKLDGISTAGTVPDVTGADGCVATTVVTTAIDTTATDAKLTFTLGTASGFAPITVTNGLILLAVPSVLKGEGGPVTLTLLTGNGTPVPGIQIVGTCTGDPSIGISSGPGVTDANGITHATITADLNHTGTAGGSGQCVFTTATGSPSATVKVQGVDLCDNGQFSPECPNAETTTVTLSITSGNATNVSASVTSSPAGIGCSVAAVTTGSCVDSVGPGTYILTPTLQPGTTFQGWQGDCTPATGNTAKLVVGTTAVACTLHVNGT